mmetsp:Transcript_21697/g.51462  ORF Transcript_21697/g.51462 Transcript_21697/m.51462 type:complete len:336 (+) Transcript_21697:20-1027(+)
MPQYKVVEEPKNCCCGKMDCVGCATLTRSGRKNVMIVCIVIGLLAFIACVFGDGMGSYDALKGNTFNNEGGDSSWREYVDSCNIDGDLPAVVNGALGLFLAAWVIILVCTIWALAISRGCPLCCSPCDDKDRACCANTYLSFSIIFLVFSSCFLLWMIVLMSLDKYSCNTCHDPSNDIGTINSILNEPGDCIEMNYVEVERAGIGTLGGFFGFLALLFAGLYCLGTHPQRPLPEKAVLVEKIPESIPLHLIHMDVPLPDHEVPIVEPPMERNRQPRSQFMGPPQSSQQYNQYMPLAYPPQYDAEYGAPSMQAFGYQDPAPQPGMGNLRMSQEGHA